MMIRVFLLVIFLTLPCFLSAQVYTARLKKEQPIDQFYPLTIVTSSDSIINGYGKINPVSFKDLIYVKNLPKTEFVTNWIVIKNIKEAVIIKNDKIKLFPLSVKTGGIAQGLLNQLIYEDNSIRLFESLVPYFDNVYFLEIKNLSNSKKHFKFISLNKEKIFRRSAKKVFKICPELVDKIDLGHYTNTFDDLILLIKDYPKVCQIRH